MKKIIFIPCLILSFQFLIYPQGCCTTGTSSLSGIMRNILPLNNLSITTHYENNYLGSSYSGRSHITDPLNRTADVTFFNLIFEYGLTNKVSVLAIIPYSYHERNITVTSASNSAIADNVSFKSNGLGDILLLAKYELITPDFFSPFAFAIGGGAKLPVGNYKKEDNGTRLPEDLQPGTGAADILLWSFASYPLRKFNSVLYFNFLYTYSGTNMDGYRIGDEFLFSFGEDYRFTDYISASIRFRGRLSKPDFADGRILNSTGSTSYDLLPFLNYSENNYTVSIYKLIPLYRNTRGIQLMVSDVFGIQFQYLLNFN